MKHLALVLLLFTAPVWATSNHGGDSNAQSTSNSSSESNSESSASVSNSGNSNATVNNTIDLNIADLMNQKLRAYESAGCDTQLGSVSVGEVSHSVTTLSACVGRDTAFGGTSAYGTITIPIVPKSVKKAREAQERKLSHEADLMDLLRQQQREMQDMREELNRQRKEAGKKVDEGS